MMSYESAGPVATTLPYHIAGPQSYSYTRESAHQPAAAPGPGSQASRQHSRTASSSAFPAAAIQSYQQRTVQNSLRGSSIPTHSRQASASGSINSTNQTPNMSMQRAPTTTSIASASSVPRRSTSSRSSTGTSTPTSYVALMRKQKATVWCGRSQSLDGQTLAAQKAAKARAIREVSGPTASSGRTSTINSGGVVGKIRYGGVPKAPGYITAGNLSGAGVPMRLSANEMLGDEEEGGSMHQGDNSMLHGRENGSGRSSTNSAKYRSGYPRPDQGRFSSQASTPPASGNESPQSGIPEHHKEDGYFDKEDEDRVTDMQGPSAVKQALNQAKNAEDLRRRGSVDERAMSMGAGVRLFVANPDVDN